MSRVANLEIACALIWACSLAGAQLANPTAAAPGYTVARLEGPSSGRAISNVFVAGGTVLNGSPHAALFTLDGRFFLDLGGAAANRQPAYALAVNDIGQAAGYSGNRAVLFTEGRVIEIPALPYFANTQTSSRAVGITRYGQVVGWEASDRVTHAFLYDNGVITDLGEGSATAINSQGNVIGKCLSGGQWHAALVVRGAFHDLGVLPGDSASVAAAVNEFGVIVGSSAGPGYLSGTGRPRVRAFTHDGRMKALPSLPNDYQTVPQGINKAGIVVGCGFQFDNSGNLTAQHGLVWTGGKVFDLNSLVPQGTPQVGCAYGINILGQIVAAAADSTGTLVLTPAHRK